MDGSPTHLDLIFELESRPVPSLLLLEYQAEDLSLGAGGS